MSEKCCCCGMNQEGAEQPKEKAKLDKMMNSDTPTPLFCSGHAMFHQFHNKKITSWTRAAWTTHKEVINAAISMGWDNELYPWKREMQYFWRFALAFGSFGVASLAAIDSDYYKDACDIMRKSVLLMRDAGAQDNWVRLGWSKDPLTTKNVMYKGLLNLMYGLYQLMSGNVEFEEEHIRLTNIMVQEIRHNYKERGFYGIECEDDQYFPPCNSTGILGFKVYDILHGTDYAKELSYPTAKFIEQKMTDKETGINYFRYHPTHDYVEPLLVGDAWATACLHYFNKDITEKAAESIKREFLMPIKNGQECFLRATRDSEEPSTDFEQSMWSMYIPLMLREIPDVEVWEKYNRFMIGANGISLENDKLVFTEIEPWQVSLYEGYLFLGCVHVGWKEIFEFDWKSLQKRSSEEVN